MLDAAVRARLEQYAQLQPPASMSMPHDDVAAALDALDAATQERDESLRDALFFQQQRDAATHALADERRTMHVYSPANQVTHCGCRLCGERQAVVQAAQACYRGEGPQAYTALLAAAAALPEEG